MKGLIINYNEEEKQVAVKDGMIVIDLFDNNGDSRMYIEGVDYGECQNFVWHNSPLKIGDKFEIKVTEIDVPSTPAKIIEDKKIKRPKTKLEFFHELEVELKNQGLI